RTAATGLTGPTLRSPRSGLRYFTADETVTVSEARSGRCIIMRRDDEIAGTRFPGGHAGKDDVPIGQGMGRRAVRQSVLLSVARVVSSCYARASLGKLVRKRTMIHHLSIAARDPKHVARVLAEFMGGLAVPFPPNP